MNAFTKTDLLQLIDRGGERCVSIYLPWTPAGDQNQQNRIRFRNLLRQAETGLQDRGASLNEAQELLVPAVAILDGPDSFWRTTGSGLAAFLTSRGLRQWWTPFEVVEACVVGRRVHVTPLIAWATNQPSFHILAISQKAVRLLRVDGEVVEPCDIPNLPESINDVLSLDSRDGEQQVHAGQPHAGKQGVVFHGQGGAPDAAKKNIVNYLRQVDRAVTEHLTSQGLPLVYVGVDSLFPLYRDVNRYANLAEAHVSGNPDLLSAMELRSRAAAVVQIALESQRAAEVARYGELSAHGRTSNHVAEIVVAAHSGAVATLFIEPTLRRLGFFDPATLDVSVCRDVRPGSEDLVNLAATFVLQRYGQVVICDDGHIPGGGTMAAIMRYPLASTYQVPASVGAS